MNGRSADFEETIRLISGLLDGRLSDGDRIRLELQLEADADARRIYMQMVDQEIELACLVAPAESARIIPMDAPPRPHANWSWWLGAAAALVAIAALWMWPKPDAPLKRQVVIAETDPIRWSEDLESGSARGWRGELVSEGLPAGSKFGIRAAAEQMADGLVYQISPPADWRDGLATLTARSTLHVTYRLGKPTWLNVFMHTLPDDPGRGQVAMFKLGTSEFPGVAGQWQTASIPFSLFERKVFDAATGQLVFGGGPPQPGELVAALVFSAPHELNLVIDRIWITPDGTGSETIQTVP